MCVRQILYIFILLIIIDLIWLSIIKNKYSEQILNIQKVPMEINYYSALMTYIIMAFGVYYFIKDIDKANTKKKILSAFVLGIVAYGVYDFTNGTIFKDWNWSIAFFDILWGGILMGSTVYILDYFKVI